MTANEDRLHSFALAVCGVQRDDQQNTHHTLTHSIQRQLEPRLSNKQAMVGYWLILGHLSETAHPLRTNGESEAYMNLLDNCVIHKDLYNLITNVYQLICLATIA